MQLLQKIQNLMRTSSTNAGHNSNSADLSYVIINCPPDVLAKQVVTTTAGINFPGQTKGAAGNDLGKVIDSTFDPNERDRNPQINNAVLLVLNMPVAEARKVLQEAVLSAANAAAIFLNASQFAIRVSELLDRENMDLQALLVSGNLTDMKLETHRAFPKPPTFNIPSKKI